MENNIKAKNLCTLCILRTHNAKRLKQNVTDKKYVLVRYVGWIDRVRFCLSGIVQPVATASNRPLPVAFFHNFSLSVVNIHMMDLQLGLAVTLLLSFQEAPRHLKTFLFSKTLVILPPLLISRSCQDARNQITTTCHHSISVDGISCTSHCQ